MARKRRTAEEARRLILDAAEKRLNAVGPGGIRLQEVAADVGVSHPAILHHFGSRRGLVDAVVQRAVSSLRNELLEALSRTADDTRTTAILDHVFEVFADRGQARLMAWLLLSGEDGDSLAPTQTLEKIAQAVHSLRASVDPERPLEDTQFVVLLAALVLFGDAVAGDLMRTDAGLTDDDASPRFRQWLARLLVAHIEGRVAKE